MPRPSVRRDFIRDIDEAMKLSFVFEQVMDAELENMIDIRVAAECFRFFTPRQPIPKNRAMMDMLHMYGETEFRQETRMTRHSFKTLVRFIENHPKFCNRHTRTQPEPCHTPDC